MGHGLASEPPGLPKSYADDRRMGVGAREKKWIELQNRVYKAQLIIPMHIPFRVFEDPRECMEAEEIVKRLVLLS